MKQGIVAVIAVVVVASLLMLVPRVQAEQVWQRYPNNPVMSTSASGWDSAHITEVFVLKDETEYKMYYTSWGLTVMAIGLATSNDGFVWTRQPGNPVLGASTSGWDGYAVGAPTILKENGIYKMWYNGDNGSRGAIGYATSEDGIVWDKHGAPVVTSTPGSWDQGAVSAPTVLHDDAGYKMYYMGNDGVVWHMGLATSVDGITWTKHPGNPLFSPRSGGWDSGEVGHPSVLLLDGYYHMWYGNTYSVGHATSGDGIAWTRESSPVLDPLAPNESCRVVDPTLLSLDGNLHMWYVTGCDLEGVGYATTGQLPTPTPTLTPIPTRTRTPTITPSPTFDPATRPRRVYLPVIVKDVPPPPTPTRTPTRTATATPIPPGMSPFFSEGFEGAWPGPWATYDSNGGADGEYYWAKRPCLPFQGQHSAWAIGGGADGAGLGCGAMYPNRATSWLVYGPFGLQNMTAAELRFWLWLNTEGGHDGVCRTASVDGTNFYGTCTSGNTLGWVERTLDFRNVYGLGNLVGSPQVWIGLSFESNESVTYPQGAFAEMLAPRPADRPRQTQGWAGLPDPPRPRPPVPAAVRKRGPPKRRRSRPGPTAGNGARPPARPSAA